MLFNVFANKVKDAALQQLAKWFANRYHLKPLGRITNLRLDSMAQEISVSLDLHGEEASVELTMRYRVISSTMLEISEVKSSRQWIAELINHVIPAEQKCLEVPHAVTQALSKVKPWKAPSPQGGEVPKTGGSGTPFDHTKHQQDQHGTND
ncbi:hypothetical protein [Prosthecobacter sp.]|uniref:hypothetical protein n=1 Tax=Prosthecobacter sp. TaxID=1965333 RepID=UPI0024870D59|nr:hypothetical protein [Prosthecobacter sp.]MDI1312852.1 hypothetical protein [Prosthecobacter sp.]